MNDIFENLKAQIPLSTYLGTPDKLICCPVPAHDDKHPSCSVDHSANRWHCYACGIGGDVFDLVKLQYSLEPKQAAEWLGERYGVKVEWTPAHREHRDKQKRIQAARWIAVKTWHQDLMERETPFHILEGRGFSTKIMGDMFLGYSQGNLAERFQKHYPFGLQELTEEDFIQAGILCRRNGKVMDVFSSRLIYPLIYAGQVVNISGRSIIEGEPRKYIHLDGVAVDYLYNEAALTNPDKKVWLMEGHPDTIAAMDSGIQAVGVLGTGGLTRPEKLKHLKQVFICADNDDAGNKAAAKWGALILKENPDIEIKIVQLPDGINDFNDWTKDVLARKADIHHEYKNLEEKAKGFLEWKISQITCFEDIPQAWPIIESLAPISRDAVFRKLRDQLGKTVQLTTLRNAFKEWQNELHLTLAKSAKITDVCFAPPDFKSAAVEFYETEAGHVGHFGFWANIKRNTEDGTEVAGLEPVLIQATHTQDGIKAELITLADLSFDILARRVPEASLVQGRWSDKAMKAFINKPEERIKTGDLIEKIRGLIRQYIWYRDDSTYTLMALYALGTYLAKNFDAFPYLLFNGMKGTGKTNSLMLMEEICFNSMMASSCTISTTFRLIENSFCTWIRDEAEAFNTGNQLTPDQLEENTILNSGYKKGATVRRTAMGKNGEATLQSFDVYSPKIFGGIRVVNHVLADRSILVRTNKKPKETAVELAKMIQERRKWKGVCQKIRDDIYIWALSIFPTILEAYEGFPSVPGIEDREWELWLPLFTLARIADCENEPDCFFVDNNTGEYGGNYLPEMISHARRVISEKKIQNKDESFDLKVLDTLYLILNEGQVAFNANYPSFYPSNLICKRLNEILKEESAIKHDISVSKLHQLLLQTGVITDRASQIKRAYFQTKVQLHTEISLEAINKAMESI